MTKREEHELEALRYAQIPALPEAAGPDTPVWIFGIAEVLTYNMLDTYAVVRNSYGQAPEVIKSFGDGGVARIGVVHPYKFLDKKYIPTFDKENSAKNFVCKVYGVEKREVAKLGKDVVLRLIYNYCIKRQLQEEADEAARKLAKIEQEALFENVRKIRNSE